ncbi:transcriptional regulator NrdR [Parvularcula sp. IMCC14364]|uniref:transcriptional regulator NrdR n=1 Tax=Parvularcula sp. IMCC14364 TaxID=3067902 RepID=UPI0027407CC2|nr:transcriptional regulator NrdR [Parvularcula sp. IMCC14364]
MRCPFCASEDTQVKDSRPTEDGAAIRRRRLCGSCDARFTTFERVQLRELVILKSSGKKVPFDREKLVRSISIAVRKREIDQDKVETMVSTIVRKLEALGDTEIGSSVLGEMVMQGLQELDEVAFVRYASVYNNFSRVEDFEKFLSRMAGQSE